MIRIQLNYDYDLSEHIGLSIIIRDAMYATTRRVVKLRENILYLIRKMLLQSSIAEKSN